MPAQPNVRETGEIATFIAATQNEVRDKARSFVVASDWFSSWVRTSGEYHWRSVCEFRSGLEFFRDFYGGPAPEVVAEMELPEIDEAVRINAEVNFHWIRPEDVPPGIPPSHWWWFLAP